MSMRIMLRGARVTAEKDMRIYYRKAPVLIFGLLFPLFMFVSFYIGRDISITDFFPGFVAMTLFFTASSVGPLITPWEKQARTYERLLSYPVTVSTVILGDMAASALFGILITAVVASVGIAALGVAVTSIAVFAGAIIAGCVCFASLGVLLASPSSGSPPNIMMLSSLVRFPLIFISGIFVPLSGLSGLRLALSYCSPLTYLVDACNYAMGGESAFHPAADVLVLVAVSAVFLAATRHIQRRMLLKGL